MAQTADLSTAGPLDVEEVRRLCGDEPDWKVQAILDSGADIAELEAAVAWAAGQDETPGSPTLSGRAAEVYEILMADAPPDEER
jgi:hypothetical protein